MVNEETFVILVYLYGVNKKTCLESNVKVEFHDCNYYEGQLKKYVDIGVRYENPLYMHY